MVKGGEGSVNMERTVRRMIRYARLTLQNKVIAGVQTTGGPRGGGRGTSLTDYWPIEVVETSH